MKRIGLQMLWRLCAVAVGLTLIALPLLLLAGLAGVSLPSGWVLTPPGSENAIANVSLKSHLGEISGTEQAIGVAGSILALITGLGILISAFSLTRPRENWVVLHGSTDNTDPGGGYVKVSLKSLYTLVTHVAERVEGVRAAKTLLQWKRNGWHVQCDAAVLPEQSVPEVASRLKEALKRSLEHHTGMPVSVVNVETRLTLPDERKRVIQ